MERHLFIGAQLGLKFKIESIRNNHHQLTFLPLFLVQLLLQLFAEVFLFFSFAQKFGSQFGCAATTMDDQDASDGQFVRFALIVSI